MEKKDAADLANRRLSGFTCDEQEGSEATGLRSPEGQMRSQSWAETRQQKTTLATIEEWR